MHELHIFLKEFVAVAVAVCWMRQFAPEKKLTLWIDNSSVVASCKASHSKNALANEILAFLLRVALEAKGQLEFKWINTTLQKADPFTRGSTAPTNNKGFVCPPSTPMSPALSSVMSDAQVFSSPLRHRQNE